MFTVVTCSFIQDMQEDKDIQRAKSDYKRSAAQVSTLLFYSFIVLSINIWLLVCLTLF